MNFIKALFGLCLGSIAYADTSNFSVLDVRTPQEYEESHIAGAQNIDFLNSDYFKTEIAKLDKSKVYKVYCRSGNRSGKATDMMKSLGFKDVENVGSLQQAAQTLNKKCEGKKPC